MILGGLFDLTDGLVLSRWLVMHSGYNKGIWKRKWDGYWKGRKQSENFDRAMTNQGSRTIWLAILTAWRKYGAGEEAPGFGGW